jgi:hypothetical protein
MAKDISDDEDFDDDVEDNDDPMLDDYEDIETKPVPCKDSSGARRRLEQLKEEKALERLLKGDFYDWD